MKLATLDLEFRQFASDAVSTDALRILYEAAATKLDKDFEILPVNLGERILKVTVQGELAQKSAGFLARLTIELPKEGWHLSSVKFGQAVVACTPVEPPTNNDPTWN